MKLAKRARWAVQSVLDVARIPSLLGDRRRLDAEREVEGLLPLLCRRAGKSHVVADQVVEELRQLAALVAERKPSVVLEIGTAKGGTLYLWSRLAREGAFLVSIDLPGELGSVRPSNRWVYRSFGRHRSQTIVTLAADSHAASTRDRLAGLLAGRKVDFFFIDGDHRYEGVKSDFEDYLPFLADGALVALHDVAIPPSGSIHVKPFWDELRSRLDGREFTAAGDDFRGIGVVEVGGGAATRRATPRTDPPA